MKNVLCLYFQKQWGDKKQEEDFPQKQTAGLNQEKTKKKASSHTFHIQKAKIYQRSIHKEFMSHHKSCGLWENTHVSLKKINLSFILLFYFFENNLNLF